MKDRFLEIPARINKTVQILDEIADRLNRFEEELIPKLGKNTDSVLIPVQLLENGYTAVETLFLRISQTFENSLDAPRWHAHLLDKMTLEIPGIRPRVISETLYKKLSELLRFRHFKRYYFELDYDWRKIDLLIAIFRESLPLLKYELGDFSKKIELAAADTPASDRTDPEP